MQDYQEMLEFMYKERTLMDAAINAIRIKNGQEAMSTLSAHEVRMQIRKASEWIKSPEGQKELQKMRKETTELCAEFQETRKVDLETWLRPYNK